MEQRDEMEKCMAACLVDQNSCPVEPRPASGSALDQANQIALLGETIHRLEKENKQLAAEARAEKQDAMELRGLVSQLEDAIVAQSRHIAEQRREIDELTAELMRD